MLNINERAKEAKLEMGTIIDRLEQIHEEMATLESEASGLKNKYPVDRTWEHIYYTVPVYTGDGTLWRRMK